MKPHGWVLAALLSFVASTNVAAQSGGQWHAAFTEQGAGAKFGWAHPAYPDEFAGPFLECVEPGKTVSFFVPVDGVREGQTATLHVSNGAESVELAATVDEGEAGFGAMLSGSNALYRLFRGPGTLSVQIGTRRPETFSLVSAPAAFGKFAKACRLAGGMGAAGQSFQIPREALEAVAFMEVWHDSRQEAPGVKRVVKVKDRSLTLTTWNANGQVQFKLTAAAESPCLYRVSTFTARFGDEVHTLDFSRTQPDAFRRSADRNYVLLEGVRECRVSGDPGDVGVKPGDCETHKVYAADRSDEEIVRMAQTGRRMMAKFCKR